jgi:predicted RNA-binding Zn ribbon-like protein
MLRVSWEWLGMAPALDLANTVAIVDGAERDLIDSPDDFEQWARCEAPFLPQGSLQLLKRVRPKLLDLRSVVRKVLAAAAADDRPPKGMIENLNRVSSRAPQWLELDADSLAVREQSSGTADDEVLARYARSAMKLVAAEGSRLRRCPAPSCGMFYVSNRRAQRWCSTQCGTRARVARHYNSHRHTRVS